MHVPVTGVLELGEDIIDRLVVRQFLGHHCLVEAAEPVIFCGAGFLSVEIVAFLFHPQRRFEPVHLVRGQTGGIP